MAAIDPTFRPKFTLLHMLQSKSMLEDTPIMPRLEQLHAAMDYPLLSLDKMTPVQALHELQRQASQIPQLSLRRFITPGEENSYNVDLTLGYEQVLNQNQRVAILATAFLGHLRAVHSRINLIKPVFTLWWVVGAQEIMDAFGQKKLLNDKSLGVFAADEFSQSMEERDIEVSAVIDAVTLLLTSLKANLKQASDTYQLGKDQINIALTDNRVPNAGTLGRAPGTYRERPAQDGAMTTLEQTFGERVQQQAEDDDSFNLAGDIISFGEATESRVDLIAQHEEEGLRQVHAEQNDDILASTPESPAAPEAEPEVVKVEPVVDTHKPGTPYVIATPVDLNAPGKVAGCRSGKSKVQLTAQVDPTENGVYLFMGHDQPLAKKDAGETVTTPAVAEVVLPEPVKAEAPEPVVAVIPEPVKAAPAPPPETTERIATADPFAEVKVTGPAVTTPRVVTPPPPPPVPAATAEDDIFANFGSGTPSPTTPAPAVVVVADDDDIFSNIDTIVDSTPATKELAEGLPSTSTPQAVPEPPPAIKVEPPPPVVKVEAPAQVAAPSPAATAAVIASAQPAATPGATTASPFRRMSPAAIVTGKKFVPPAGLLPHPVAAAAGLDEIM